MDTNQFGKLGRGPMVKMAAPPLRGGPVIARLMPPKSRMRLLCNLFGKHFITVENLIYITASRMCPNYEGGDWAFYELSNGGFYMVPLAAPDWFVVYAAKEYQGGMLANPAGMLITAMALNQLTYWRDGELMAEMYYRLRDFINQQPEAAVLCNLLD